MLGVHFLPSASAEISYVTDEEGRRTRHPVVGTSSCLGELKEEMKSAEEKFWGRIC